MLKKVMYSLLGFIATITSFALLMPAEDQSLQNREIPSHDQFGNCEKYTERWSEKSFTNTEYDSLKDLVGTSAVIVKAKIVNCGPDPAELDTGTQRVVYEFDVSETLKGDLELGEIALEFVSGSTGQLGIRGNALPELSKGDEVVLFLRNISGKFIPIWAGESTAVLNDETGMFEFYSDGQLEKFGPFDSSQIKDLY